MKGRWIAYSADELAWIETHHQLPRAELHARFMETFGRPDVSQANLTALCKRRGWLTGRTGQFHAGQVSHNKGKKGWRAQGCEKTWFTPGVRRGRASQIYQPIGTERISKDGYVQRKVNDDLPFQKRWRGVHLIRWEAINGPLPQGHALKCLDGNRANTDPENWIAIPRGMMPRLVGRWSRPYDTAPDELKPIILATARLDHAARQALRSRNNTEVSDP